MYTLEIIGNGTIPRFRQEEFIHKVEKILKEGGIMDINKPEIYDKTIYLTEPVIIENAKFDILYSYLDSCTFIANFFDKYNCRLNKCSLYSEKHYFKIIYAIYILYEIYADDFAVCLVDGKIYDNTNTIAWLNYLFNEQYTNNRILNFDNTRLNETKIIDTQTFLNCNNDDLICLTDQNEGFSDEFRYFLKYFKQKIDNIISNNIIINEDDKVKFFIEILDKLVYFFHEAMDDIESIDNFRYTSVLMMKQNVFFYLINNIQDKHVQASILLLSELIDSYDDKLSLKFIIKYFNMLSNCELRKYILS